jgi:transcriptional regulator with XRE-family HTH domain
MAAKKALPRIVRDVGSRLRTAREDVGVVGVTLAKAARVAPEALSCFERGKKGLATPNLLSVLQAAHGVGVDLNYVISGAGDSQLGGVVLGANPNLLRQLLELVEASKRNDSSDAPPSDAPVPRKKRRKRS